MRRRHFLAASLTASAAALAPSAFAGQTHPVTSSRQFYLLRRYHLQSGPQTRLTASFFADALMPALNRLGLAQIGAFKLDVGPDTPSYYLLVPATDPVALLDLDHRLADDADFLKAAEAFWSAPATAPSFLRVESSLYSAFPGWPRLTVPTGSAAKPTRIFQLRTYESPSDAAHVRKVEMFHKGEFEIFQNAGAQPIFFGDALVAPNLPQLTYMLGFEDQASLTESWKRFASDPAWKKLSTSPRYAYEDIVSNITNLILSPLAASQF